jgi:hypothetical protein
MVSQLLLTNDDTKLYELMNYYSNIITYIITKENNRIYYQKTKQKRKKEYQENKEERIEYQKQYNKQYIQTPNWKKANRINSWKFNGLICNDFNVIYEIYINTTNCDNCNCILTTDRYNTSTTKCMDHDHNTGLFRNILCQSCNVKRRW